MDNTANPPKRNSGASLSVVQFGSILALLAGIRFFELATKGWHFRVMAYELDAAWWIASILAGIVCFFATSAIRKHFSSVISILISMLIGGAVTLLVSSVPGMVVGLIVGAMSTFDISRQMLFMILKAFLWLGLPAAVIGGLGGFLGGMSIIRVHTPLDRHWMSLSILIVIAIVSCVWIYYLGRKERRAKGLNLLGDLVAFSAFFVVCTCAFLLGVEFDNQRRIAVGNTWASGQIPLGYNSLVLGLKEPTNLLVSGSFETEKGRLLSPFSNFDQIMILTPHGYDHPDDQGADREIDVSGLEEINLRSVTSVYAQTLCDGFTDKGLLSLRQCDQLNMLVIPGSDVSDAGMEAVQEMQFLVNLDLSDSNVTSDGLSHLHPRAPLAFTNLAGCPVTDEVFTILSGRMVEQLTLAGTKIKGDTLKDAKLNSMYVLNVANTEFDEKNLRYLPSKAMRKLDLSGTSVTTLGLQLIAKHPGIAELALLNTDLDDDTVKELANCTLSSLEIDATNLTQKSCKTLSKVTHNNLVFKVDKSNEGSLAEIINRSRKMRDEICKLKGVASNLSIGGRPVVTITIDGPTIQREMIPLLRELDCEMTNADVVSTDGKTKLKSYVNPRYQLMGDLGAHQPQAIDADDIESLFDREDRQRQFSRVQASETK